jgi:GT2 family glycosyltransferase/glycosyltransferase involved in cell wall biosynthesis
MTDLPTCSAIVVTYNGRDYLDRCIGALIDLDYPAIEILAIDNGSRDGSVDYLREQFPSVTVYENTSNNFASAVQLGIDRSSGEFVALVNNDTQLDRQWLRVLADYLRAKRAVGGVAGKICFPDGRIDSVGHVRLADHYWSDRGIGERDRGQYDRIEAVEGLCWAAALFRRECLTEVGEIDRQFVMYFEDVDYAERCRRAGWELHYVPEAIAIHEGGASSQGSNLTDYFCNRNRFLFLAKHEPDQLLGAIETSGFMIRQRWDWLLEAMTMAWHKLMLHHDTATVERLLPDLVDRVAALCGGGGVDLALAKLSAIHRDRPLTIAIYDHALHTIGGGQRYLTTLASVLQHRFQITFIANKPVEIPQLEAWYGLTLDRCQLEILPLLFFDRQNAEIDGTWVTAEMTDNPFTPVSERSADFDIFINANQLTRVEPRSPVSLFFCHFPDSWRDAHFFADRYTLLIANSDYTERWIRKLWNLEPSLRIYPPVVTPEMTPDTTPRREPIILSVARFDPGGNKQQWEMVQAFRQLRDRDPERLRDWRLVLVGGSAGESEYLERLRVEAKLDRVIELHVNLPLDQVNGFYRRASLFWHLCGFDEFLPERVEHFGMATVEAMQQGCIPIVFDGGGQREIVVDGVSGYRVATFEALIDRTFKLIGNPIQRHAMTQRVRDRGQCFNLGQFTDRVNTLFDAIAREFTTIALPDPGEIYQECKTLSIAEIQADL